MSKCYDGHRADEIVSANQLLELAHELLKTGGELKSVDSEYERAVIELTAAVLLPGVDLNIAHTTIRLAIRGVAR
ncbi:hypothetical protein [Mycobacteroides abscessus]|uniref:hypothetical protein n=1 Tax=Mycobacteroides abscessus TaxID=36809 RepID=UPI0009265149|nr:hypothetical protein [Mycobacteroides abscessus]SIB67714.1 Uncharacterised protein [Mycobacteroides abscessus subsp. abscessus]